MFKMGNKVRVTNDQYLGKEGLATTARIKNSAILLLREYGYPKDIDLRS